MKICEIMKNIPSVGGENTAEIRRITINSRTAGPGDLFVCLKGAVNDGHDHAPGAYDAGCRAFLCEKELPLPADAIQIKVNDTRAALPFVSAAFFRHPADELHIIGITGTKGKTTTALITAAILNAAGMNCAYIGSNGVVINGEHTDTLNTTPESLFLHKYFDMMRKAGVKYAVLEVSSQALANHRTDGIPFETVAYTNLSVDHIGGAEHPTFEHYRDSKKRLFTDEYSAKYAVFNCDDPYSEYMLDSFSGKKTSYGFDKKSDFRAENAEGYRTSTALGVAFDCIKNDVRTSVSLMSPGIFSVENALCAMAICQVYGVSPLFSASILEQTTVTGRFEVVPALPERTFIIDYSHNGISLTSALSTLREYRPERIICVFGSVGGRTRGRRRELAEAADALADYIIITSDNPDFENPKDICRDIASYIKNGTEYEIIPDRAEAIRRAVEMSGKGDIVLFAGKGHERFQLIYGKKVPFCERDEIMSACSELVAGGSK